MNTGERRDPDRMARQFVERHGVTYPTVMDRSGEMAQAYQVEALPTAAVIDRGGVIRYLQPGFDERAVIDLIESLL